VFSFAQIHWFPIEEFLNLHRQKVLVIIALLVVHVSKHDIFRVGEKILEREHPNPFPSQKAKLPENHENMENLFQSFVFSTNNYQKANLHQPSEKLYKRTALSSFTSQDSSYSTISHIKPSILSPVSKTFVSYYN
jgi:hypothetical protein